MKVKVKKINENAKMPKMVHQSDSGFDLYASESLSLKPGKRKLVKTGIKISIPQSMEGQIRPKSGLAINYGITVLNTPGTIDSGYRGEIKVILANFGEKEFKVKKGKKIAQLVFSGVKRPELIEVKKLDDTKRGRGGFGSTGLR